MRYIEWGFLFILSGIGMALANFVGFQVGFMESLPGVAILLAISCLGVIVSKLVPLKLPIVAYVSIIGLLCACPVSPCREFVISSAGKINFWKSRFIVKSIQSEYINPTSYLFKR